MLYQNRLFNFEGETTWLVDKWLNSIKLVKEMGDLHNLDKGRYRKLTVFTKSSGKIVFKDLDILIDEYENKLCARIVKYKYDKIFLPDHNKKSSKNLIEEVKAKEVVIQETESPARESETG